MTTISELIIPQTETAGAKAVVSGKSIYIDL
jgi:hypothetical protein